MGSLRRKDKKKNHQHVDGSTVDGSNVDGSNMDGSTVDGSNMDGSTVDGSNGEKSPVDGKVTKGIKLDRGGSVRSQGPFKMKGLFRSFSTRSKA